MLDTDDTGDDIGGHARFYLDGAARAFDDQSFFVLHTVTECGFRMNIGRGFRGGFAQARERAGSARRRQGSLLLF
jgi:hypothetical protein